MKSAPVRMPRCSNLCKGEPDGPIPLNPFTEEHEHHQHVKPRPFARARDRFHHKTDEAQFIRLFRRAVCDRVQALFSSVRLRLHSPDGQLKKPTRTLQINYEDVTGIKVNSEVRYAGCTSGTCDRDASPHCAGA